MLAQSFLSSATRLIVLVACTFDGSSMVAAQGDPSLEGTWTTKSRKVLTGPGFYDPVNERLEEPQLTGISYSFTSDGYYEEAYYRAIANPTTPSCPQGIMQWQHGTYVKNANGSLTLTPIAVDGRQLQSDPCNYKSSIYTRYSQKELISKYQVGEDAYSKAQRLDMFKFDGSPFNPMYLAYKPPMMLPTQTLNPTTAASTGAAQATGKAKRDIYEGDDIHPDAPLNKGVLQQKKLTVDATKWWWIGLGMTSIGSVAYFCF